MSADEWTDAYQVARGEMKMGSANHINGLYERIAELDSGQQKLARLCAQYEEEIDELERREALLTACVKSRDFVDALDNMLAIQYVKLNPATTANTRLAAISARQALTEAGFPWTDGDR
jgi:hypothetical protein